MREYKYLIIFTLVELLWNITWLRLPCGRRRTSWLSFRRGRGFELRTTEDKSSCENWAMKLWLHDLRGSLPVHVHKEKHSPGSTVLKVMLKHRNKRHSSSQLKKLRTLSVKLFWSLRELSEVEFSYHKSSLVGWFPACVHFPVWILLHLWTLGW